ncbi:MAG: hypothetical protein JJ896_06030 [Rhodothermales bacterium]|nr:hypothetical protein [Rhodothermales bacterium]MBO6779191.1 hypothetical protein [Rhodothermales bacterium]
MNNALPRLSPELESVVRSRSGRAYPSRPDFRLFLRRVLKTVSGGIGTHWAGYRAELMETAQSFINGAADDLAEWSGLLAAGAISADDFRWLLNSRAATSEMLGLSATGMSRGQVSHFRALLIEGLVSAAVTTFLGTRSD